MITKQQIIDFHKNGFLFLPKFIKPEIILQIYNDTIQIYQTQIERLILNPSTDFIENLETLFQTYFSVFIACGKQAQHLISLHQLGVSNEFIELICNLGIKNPIISTRPVLFSNSPRIAKKSINHTIPAHQDWASMQGSINSLIIWTPFIQIKRELGPIHIIPESHKNGLIITHKDESFGIVDNTNPDDFITFEVEPGDILVFSSFLVHKSGINITNNIRWSAHFRYNDLDDESFIERGYPHAYIYRPIDEWCTPEFNTLEAIQKYLHKYE